METLQSINGEHINVVQIIVSVIITVLGIVLKHYYNKKRYDLNGIKKSKKTNKVSK